MSKDLCSVAGDMAEAGLLPALLAAAETGLLPAADAGLLDAGVVRAVRGVSSMDSLSLTSY